MKKILLLALLLPFSAGAQIIDRYAGSACGDAGDGGPATTASMSGPSDLAFDAKGNLFIADVSNHRIRRVDTHGIITTVAGTGTVGYTGDGIAATASRLNAPYGVAADTAGNVYIGDTYNHRVRRVDVLTGMITTVAGNGTAGFSGDSGPATAATLDAPSGLAVDKKGNLFISDTKNNRIRKVTPGGVISTVAGNGILGYSGEGVPALAASFYQQTDVEVDETGSLYIADYNNNRVRKVDTADIIRTIAGNGTAGLSGDGSAATLAMLNNPYSTAVDVRGILYIADRSNHRIRKVDKAGIITTYAGTGFGLATGDGGPATAAQLKNPYGVAVSREGNVYLAGLSCTARYIIDSMNYTPFFTKWRPHAVQVCRGVTTGIDTVLSVTDFSSTNKDTWACVTLPLHGSVSGPYVTTAMNGTMLPSGLTYAPATGYVGNDSFKVLVSNGMVADTVMVYAFISDCALGVTATSGSGGMAVFPNPVDGELNIVSPTPMMRLQITTLPGQTVYERLYPEQHFSIDVSNLPAGLYFIKADGVGVGKFVKR